MGKINVLSFAVANLIAAGEVVDRPASVIKELLENAIDAGATRVTVEIQHGGITFMRVADNGCGMEKEDLPVAIRRHATSKIREADDLDGIATLGFRGEALAAIAAVSDLRIITRTAQNEFGYMLQSSGGEVKDVVEQGCPVGTTVIVENLFGNVPARRKFLKKDVSESIAVTTYVEKIALSHPDIAIRLIVDGNLKLDTAGDGDLRSAMYAVFGRDFVARTIPVEGGNESVKVRGFIGRPDNVRPKRNFENFFINGRYINCRTAAAALEQAFTSFIPPEKFPCCVLHIEINPAAVDVNVHPAKLEVKFSNERPVFEAVYYAVRAALEANTDRPDLKLKDAVPDAVRAFVPIEEGKRESVAARQISMRDMPAKPAAAPEPFARMSAADYAARYTAEGKEAQRASASLPYRTDGLAVPKKEEIPHPPLRVSDTAHAAPPKTASAPQAPSVAPVETAPAIESWRIIGEAFHTYVIVERGEELLLIDKHAAHERVLFEDLNARRKADTAKTAQMLLVPYPLTVSAEERETLEFYRTEIEAVGFGYALTAHGAGLSEIPAGLSPAAAGELLLTLAEGLREGTGNAELARDIVFEKALYQGACKAALKAGREYPPEYVEALCRRLMALPDITVCPHGRPIAVVLTRATLHRQFGRG
ncbi:MAG: DNA mismatch repair endonuclease MutL [Clostridia bacterium]|nr:DNA mismatch repair endonuclease MutL [Clostridia bacterium]